MKICRFMAKQNLPFKICKQFLSIGVFVGCVYYVLNLPGVGNLNLKAGHSEI